MYTISVYLATFIMLLHSLVPHEHHDQLSDEAHEEEHLNADDPISWLKTVFHNDMGADHLEFFESSDVHHIELIPTQVPPALLTFLSISDQGDIPSTITATLDLRGIPITWVPISTSRRGPPSLV